MALIDEHVNEAVLKNLDRKENFTLFGLTAPYLLLVFFLIIIPVGWLFYMSFIGRDGSFSIENYERMLKSKSYIRIFITTFKISFLTTLICALLGYPLTYFMSQLSRKWAGICMIGVLIPFWTSLLVRTYAWLVLLQRKGLINNIAIDLGFISEPIKFVHNTSGTLIGMAHIMLPFLILPLYANMRAIDKDCLKAAANLGATPTRAFWTVFFPLSIPGLLAGLLIVFVICLGFYVTPAVLGGGKVIMAAMKISSNIELYFSWGAASALGVVLLVVTMLILYIASKLVSMDQIGANK
ncbi:MAG: ABC transporter permease [Rhodobacteraceae bacterium]|jgi:putative spermidine/putrescine transport system permease protein/spermidine/putrescine transport system permease protein|nr:ABC transporter permease [Paracoccaceae bacterium]MBT4778299.1 ABC transporter permease [Paracoccaceae bacterium]MBT6272252.1 ABC transporter permease [Paracoccaceae bacterium]MBT6436745.1 ABC transporter permease [Paracoccaceae bacterium]MDG2373238.1 ABC transporter permease [Paracoccaceae bacterium]|tara:strand:- start:2772 stop:3659 length:888 start_codon:yes stop_codon:yes gene_type:complete